MHRWDPEPNNVLPEGIRPKARHRGLHAFTITTVPQGSTGTLGELDVGVTEMLSSRCHLIDAQASTKCRKAALLQADSLQVRLRDSNSLEAYPVLSDLVEGNSCLTASRTTCLLSLQHELLLPKHEQDLVHQRGLEDLEAGQRDKAELPIPNPTHYDERLCK